MHKKWIDINQIYFPDGVSSVYFEGRRVKKEEQRKKKEERRTKKDEMRPDKEERRKKQ